jgi:hypothetical protein
VFIETSLGFLVSEISVCQNGRSDDGPEVESPAQPRRNDLDPDCGRVRRERVDVGVRAESKTKKCEEGLESGGIEHSQIGAAYKRMISGSKVQNNH